MYNKINIKTSKILPNESNPRLIKDDKFKKLCNSLKEFPEMLELRPIVLNEKYVILGGNMRYKAAMEIGLDELPCVIAKGLSEEKQREFIIKDNVSGGDWDWDMIANDWDYSELDEWGLEVPGINLDGQISEQDGYVFQNKVTIEFDSTEEATSYFEDAIKNNLKAKLS